jgi:hypothetical protein
LRLISFEAAFDETVSLNFDSQALRLCSRLGYRAQFLEQVDRFVDIGGQGQFRTSPVCVNLTLGTGIDLTGSTESDPVPSSTHGHTGEGLRQCTRI